LAATVPIALATAIPPTVSISAAAALAAAVPVPLALAVTVPVAIPVTTTWPVAVSTSVALATAAVPIAVTVPVTPAITVSMAALIGESWADQMMDDIDRGKGDACEAQGHEAYDSCGQQNARRGWRRPPAKKQGGDLHELQLDLPASKASRKSLLVTGQTEHTACQAVAQSSSPVRAASWPVMSNSMSFGAVGSSVGGRQARYFVSDAEKTHPAGAVFKRSYQVL
jgi:hypothetical protein